MELIPAIDLLDGRVVRLFQGDFERSSDYGADAVSVARRWVDEGATRLHIVDLDGAREGRPRQTTVMARIVAAAGVPCQVAGGLRDAGSVEDALTFGADRVVLGTALLSHPAFAADLVASHGSDVIVAALDVRDGGAVGEGWRVEARSVPVLDALRSLLAAGVQRFAVTAIERDGVLSGPSVGLLGSVRDIAPAASIIASGGITTAEDVRSLARLGIDGAILGKALYEGRLTLAEARAAAAESA
jgi:phosphoribosylformimino-5-aminoimidazole carboxamide ribotide isomerase